MAARIERTLPTRFELPTARSSKQILLCVFDVLCQSPFCELNQDQIRTYKNEISPLKDLKEESDKYLLIADKLSKIAFAILTKEMRQNDCAFDIFLNSPCHEAMKDLNQVYQEIFYLYFEKEDIGKSIDIAKKMTTGESQDLLFVKIARYYLQKNNPKAASEIVREELGCSFSKQEKLFTEIAKYYLQKDKPEAAAKIVREDLKYSSSKQEKLLVEIAEYYLQKDKPEAAAKIVREDLKYSSSKQEKLLVEIARAFLRDGKKLQAENTASSISNATLKKKILSEIE